MGAVLTAVVRAPLTAVLLLFEVTGDYRLILAMMACVATSYLGSAWLHPESIYTERLARKGIRLRFGRDVNLLELVTVQECMTPDFTTVPATMALHRLRHLFDSTRHHGFPVLDAEGLLYGIVTLTDLRVVTIAGSPAHTPVSQIATRDLIVVYPDQTLNEALEKFALADVGRIPVVSRDNPRKLLGMLRRTDIVKGYQRGVMQRAEGEQRQQQTQSIRFADQTEAQITTVSLSRQCASDGRTVRDIHLPEGVIITSIRRNEESIIPHGATVLYGGDELTILARPDQVPEVEDMLLDGICDLQEPRYHELVLPDHAPAVGQCVASLPLPQDALIVTLRRDGHTHAVHGHTRLEAGDELIILVPPADFSAAVACLTGGNKK
jgi:CIC family chloride channel protein